MLHEGHLRAAILLLLCSCRHQMISLQNQQKPSFLQNYNNHILATRFLSLFMHHLDCCSDWFEVCSTAYKGILMDLRWIHHHESQTQSQMSLRFSLVWDRHSQSFYRLPEKWIQYIQYKCVFLSVLRQERPVHLLLSASLSNGPVFVTFTVWKCLDLPQERGYWLFS